MRDAVLTGLLSFGTPDYFDGGYGEDKKRHAEHVMVDLVNRKVKDDSTTLVGAVFSYNGGNPASSICGDCAAHASFKETRISPLFVLYEVNNAKIILFTEEIRTRTWIDPRSWL